MMEQSLNLYHTFIQLKFLELYLFVNKDFINIVSSIEKVIFLRDFKSFLESIITIGYLIIYYLPFDKINQN